MEKHAQIELSGNTTFIRGLVKSSKVNSVYFVLVAKTRKLSQIKLKITQTQTYFQVIYGPINPHD